MMEVSAKKIRETVLSGSNKTLKARLSKSRNKMKNISSTATIKGFQKRTSKQGGVHLKRNSLANPPKRRAYGYFKEQVKKAIREGQSKEENRYLRMLGKIHKSQRDLRKAFQNNLKIEVNVPPSVEIKSDKPVLVLDLDETLVHSRVEKPEGGKQLWYRMENGIKIKFIMYKRPFLEQFLAEAKKLFTLVLFTAAAESYAESVLREIDPKNTIFDYRFFKQNCLLINNKVAVKDLRMFQGVDMNNIFIVDNNPACYMFQLGNALPILSYKGEKEDEELEGLLEYLKCFAGKKDKLAYLDKQFFKGLTSESDNFDELLLKIEGSD